MKFYFLWGRLSSQLVFMARVTAPEGTPEVSISPAGICWRTGMTLATNPPGWELPVFRCTIQPLTDVQSCSSNKLLRVPDFQGLTSETASFMSAEPRDRTGERPGNTARRYQLSHFCY